MDISWSKDKNSLLKPKFGFGFERIIIALEEGALVDDRRHVNIERYPNQRQLLIALNDYIWVIAYVESETEIFLKTFFPSRKATKDNMEGRQG